MMCTVFTRFMSAAVEMFLEYRGNFSDFLHNLMTILQFAMSVTFKFILVKRLHDFLYPPLLLKHEVDTHSGFWTCSIKAIHPLPCLLIQFQNLD